jgi:shikimate dehydrogenase
MDELQRYAVIGNPVAHSLSPRMQQAAFDAAGIRASYEAIEARSAADVFCELRRKGYRGWNVTTPLKEEAVRCVDRLSEEAAQANAVNVVRREGAMLVGHNTDGQGFVRAVSELWPCALSGSVLILGAGPAARAIALALRRAEVERLSCWSRTDTKARAIAPRPSEDADLVVCALPPDAVLPPSVTELARRAKMLFDLNYAAGSSPLCAPAAAQRSDGLPLLLHQGILSFEWWTNRQAPAGVMRAALGVGPASS